MSSERSDLFVEVVKWTDSEHFKKYFLLLGAFPKLWKTTISFMFVRPSVVCQYVCLSLLNNSAPTGRKFMKFSTRAFFFANLSRYFNFNYILRRIISILSGDRCTYNFSPYWRYTAPCGFVFCNPLAGYSLLAYEVSWSHTATRHSR